jgi:iron complex outermembrane receptor protein
MRPKGGRVKRAMGIFPDMPARFKRFKMFRSMFVVFAVLVCADAWAQENSVTGAVRDESGQPLAGATVQIRELSKAAVSDEFGSFSFHRVPSGHYTLTIRFVGYEEKSEPIDVPSATPVTIAMTESRQLTDEVVVFATRANDKTPTTYSNISGLSLRKQNFGQDMPMLLNWTPSVTTTSDAGAGIGYTGIRIRGIDATRINVTINGIAYNDSESQGTFWVDIPDVASSTESVQIQRGVGTSTNGAGAFGGTVNVQTIGQQREPYAEAIAGFGSFNTQRLTLRGGTGLIDNNWTFDGRVSKITSDGYIDRATSDLTSYYFSAGYYGKKTILKAITFGGHEVTYQAWNGNDAETMKTDRTFNSAGALWGADGVTGYYDNEVDDYRQDHYQLHFTRELTEKWNANVSLHYTSGRGFYEQYKQDVPFADMGLPDFVVGSESVTSSDFIVRKWLDNDFYGATFSFNYDAVKTNVVIGGAYNEYANAKHFGEIIWAAYAGSVPVRHHYYEGESEKDDGNLYAKVNYSITGSLNLFADVQWRNVRYQTAGIDDNQVAYDVHDTFNFLNPKAGVTYGLSALDQLHVSYAIANREPNRTDYLSGTEKPRHERLGNLEAGWNRASGKYSVGVNYYLMNYHDQLVLTGELDDVGNPIRANVGKSYRTGVEVDALWKVIDQLSWNVNATWSTNRNVDFVLMDELGLPVRQNTAIILSPDWIAGSQLTWNAFPRFNVSLLTKYVGKQFLDNTQNDELVLDPYLVNDVRFSYTFEPKGLKGIDLSVLVNNVFDFQYSSNGAVWDGYAYYYPQAGRNFMVMVGVRF